MPSMANLAQRGEPTVITRQGKPVAILGPVIDTRPEIAGQGFQAYVVGHETVWERGSTPEEAVGALWVSLKVRPVAQDRDVLS